MVERLGRCTALILYGVARYAMRRYGPRMAETWRAAPARARPATATVAFWLHIGGAGVGLIVVALVAGYAIWLDGLIDRAAELTNANPHVVSEKRSSNAWIAAMVGGPALLIAIWLAATAVPVWRAREAARVLAIVGASVQVLGCCGANVTGWTAAYPLLVLGASLRPGYMEEGARSGFTDRLYEMQTESVLCVLPAAALVILAVMCVAWLAACVLLLVRPRRRGR